MNIAMEQTEVRAGNHLYCLSPSAQYLSIVADILHLYTQEYVQGQLKNRYGDAFIRGNNGRSKHCQVIQHWQQTCG